MLQSLRRGTVVCAIAVMAFGLSVLAGWALGSETLKGAYVGNITVKSNTAAAFTLVGLALLLLHGTRTPPYSVLPATIVFLIGLLTGTEHLFAINLGIDELLFRENAGAEITTSPNRMGPPASVNFMLVGIALLCLSRPSSLLRNVSIPLALISGMIALLSTLGYMFGARELYGIANFTGIALPTAITFLVVAGALIGAHREGPVIQVLTSTHAGGVLARQLLPAALVLPPALGYLRTIGESYGLYDAPFGRALLVVAFMLIFVRLIWWNVGALQTIDLERFELIEGERAARKNAERANRFKDDFLATLSHELRTPLNAILGYTQLLKMKSEPGSELNIGLSTIERNSHLQAQLIADLLDMSRIISGKVRLNLQEVDLTSVVIAAVQTIELDAQKKNICLEQELSESRAILLGDPARLQQVFWNILSNAVKFTASGGQIVIKLVVEAAHASVSIRDSGRGIEPEFLHQVFDRFAQAESSTSRSYGGLGIGLSVVKELVELHKGTVDVSSAGLGRGACFTVHLPFVTKTATSGEVERDTESPVANAVSLRGISVLVVDDDADARELTGRILKHAEAEVRFAGSADEALMRFREMQPDVLVSDLGMPGKDGFELIRNIRSLPGGRGLPAVALTAFVRDKDRAKSFESGYHAHVTKPIDASLLTETVGRVFAKRLEVKEI